jgi:hypothetical protein
MTKKIFFSKKYGKLLKIKKNFFTDNNKNLDRALQKNNLYKKNKTRKNCKICSDKINGYDFESFGIKYKFCKKCSHLNGKYEDSKNFANLVYKINDGSLYASNYNYEYINRVKHIYLPKVNFIKKIIKKKTTILDVGSGAGHFLRACELKKINAEGIETNKKLCKLSKKFLKKNKLINVNLDQFENKILTTNRDCISLIGVLEHLNEPHKVFKAFKKSKAKYLFISVPLASFTIFIEHAFKNIFPRHLSGTHTHLFTEKSINFLKKKYDLITIGEWWFGLDFPDLFRSILVSSKSKKNINFSANLEKYFYKHIDEFQNILDRNKICSEVHLIFKKR